MRQYVLDALIEVDLRAELLRHRRGVVRVVIVIVSDPHALELLEPALLLQLAQRLGDLRVSGIHQERSAGG